MKANSKAKLGSGGRFKALTNKLQSEGKSAESAKKIAASIAIKRYGKSKVMKMAAAGRKRAK